MAKTLDIQVEVPDTLSEESLRLVRTNAREAIVMVLQQRGELSIREAALELGLSYEGYLDLLNEEGLPATNTETDASVLDVLRRSLQPQ